MARVDDRCPRVECLDLRAESWEPLDGAARFITVIYPFSNSFSDNTIDAIFTDNTEEGSAGTFHAEGAAVKVTVNGKEYELSYTLN